MRYWGTGEYERIREQAELVPFSPELPIETFDCGVSDYNQFLVNDAVYYVDTGVSFVHLLLLRDCPQIVAYMALLADAILLDQTEKASLNLDVPFNSVPALKIGKLAAIHSPSHYGSYMLQLAVAFATRLVDNGVACRFITVDADTEFDDNTPDFYARNGFVENQHRQYAKRTSSVSMRYDLFDFGHFRPMPLDSTGDSK